MNIYMLKKEIKYLLDKYYFLFRDYNCDLYVSVNIKAVFKFI